jgi:hypothetical protein
MAYSGNAVTSLGWREPLAISQTERKPLHEPLGPFKVALITTFIP